MLRSKSILFFCFHVRKTGLKPMRMKAHVKAVKEVCDKIWWAMRAGVRNDASYDWYQDWEIRKVYTAAA